MTGIIHPLGGGVFGTLKAEESKIRLINAMNRAGPQIPDTVNAQVHQLVKLALMQSLRPQGGQIALEVMLAAASVGFANVIAEYLAEVETGPLSGIPQTDGFAEAVVDVFRVQLNNAIVAGRVGRMGSKL